MSRTESQWQERLGTHIEPTKQGGIDVLIKGLNRYLNFNTTSGTSGYGFRDNNGVIEYKDASGTWMSLETLGSQDLQSVTDNGATTTNPIGTPRIDLNTSYTPTGTEPVGSTYWDSDNHTTSTVLENGVILQNGQEIHIYGKNVSGAPILNGTPVSIVQNNGQFTAFSTVDITTPSAYAFVGLATQDIANNSFGYVTKIGVVRGLDTTAYDEGKPVYVSLSGGLTKTYPTVPNYVINVGIVEYKHANQGRINVISSIVSRLEDLSDVNGTPLTTTGQIPNWNNTSQFFDFDKNINDYATIASVTKTTGSVLFAGATGLIEQDNANLFFDNTNNRLCVGTNTSISALTLAGDLTFPTGANRTIAVQNATSGAGNSLTLKSADGFTGQAGGNFTLTAGSATGSSATETGPAGGAFTLTGGNGRPNGSAGTAPVGGAGGGFTLTGGVGGTLAHRGSFQNIGGAGGRFQVTTGAGGTTTAAQPSTGGGGGVVQIQAGAGGEGITNGTTGGNGGNYTLTGGAGGRSIASGVNTNRGGIGSDMTFQTGAGGSALNATTNVSGRGGNFVLSAGTGGQAAGGSTNTAGVGGNFTVTAGRGGVIGNAGVGPGTTGTGGNLTFTSGDAGQANGSATDTKGGNSGNFLFATGGFSFCQNKGGNAGTFNFTGTAGNPDTRSGTVNVGGNGSSLTFTGGSGGNASGGSSNTGGNAGDITFQVGIAGTGATANGTNGSLIFRTPSAVLQTINISNTALRTLTVPTASQVGEIITAHATPGDFVRYNNSGGTTLTKFDSTGSLVFSANNIITDTTTGTKIGTGTTQKLGFWNKTPVVQQVTNAYTSDGEGSAYTGIDNLQAGTPYAKLTDLNALRTAYETLRASYDDLLTKLKNTGIVA